MFAVQFLFNQKFQQSYGSDTKATFVFTFYKSVVATVIMIIISGFKITVTPFSFFLAAISSVSGILMLYFSLKAFSVANLSVYSVFSMLGGMILPFLLGVCFYDEDLSPLKIVCCILIVLAVLLNIQKGENGKKAILYYMAVFVLNGMAGVISKIHQSSQYEITDSTGFTLLINLISVIICGAWLLIKYKKVPLIKNKNLLYSSGYGALNGIGNLFLLIALSNLPASVQYPLVTGGVMVFSTIISVIQKEKLTKKDYISTAVSFVASVLIVF
jgi:drug/metabolite transporter (DMT)-like permease